MRVLPSGEVTFAFVDVVGSTEALQQHGDVFVEALGRVQREVAHATDTAGGVVVSTEGDGAFLAFGDATSALSALQAMQQMRHEDLGYPAIRLRAGAHRGPAVPVGDNYVALAVHVASRVASAAGPGQVLATDAVVEAVKPSGWLDFGLRTLRSVGAPMRLWLVSGPKDPPRAAPLRGAGAPFIGRRDELRSLVSVVREHRLVTLTGFGGMGKTRLARQVAEELTGQPGVGDVWFIDLAAVTDPDLVPARVAEAVGVLFGVGDPLESLVQALMDHPALLVLDNVEQVIDCAPFVADLVSKAPGVRVLCTSREPLRVRWEKQIVLEPMRVPDSDQGGFTAQFVSDIESVLFFVDRIRAVRADFELTDENAPTVAAICVRLEGHPLALELAAARVRMLSLEKLLLRLDGALGVLTGGSRDMPQRHQTLRATIAWSYDALEAPQQRLLARLSVFAGPADLDLIEAVCGQELEVFDPLEVLVQRSLIRTVDQGADRRFVLLASVRVFAAEQLDRSDLQDLAERYARAVHQPIRELALTDELNRRKHAYVHAELAHVRAALAYRREKGPAFEFARLVADLEDTFIHRGLLSEYIDIATAAVPAARAAATRHPELLAGVLSNLSFAQIAFPVPLEELAGEAVATARACSDPVVKALVLSVTVADAARDADHVRTLLTELDDAIAASGERDPQRRQARYNIAAFMLRYVDPLEAERSALAIPDTDVMARPVRLAQLLLDRGEWTEAAAILADVSDLSFTGVPNPRWAALIALGRATAFTGSGRLDQARQLLHTAAAHERTAGLPPVLSAAGVADVDRVADQPADALAALESALDGLDAAAMRHRLILPLRWRRAVCLHQLGADASVELRAARDDLVSSPLYGPRELLGALVERAVHVAPDDPQRAAALIASVQAHRGRWVLPFGMDSELQALLLRLPSHTGAPGAPTAIW